MNYGKNVKTLRESKGVTQEQLANALGVSRTLITQIERGTKNITLQLAVDIARYLEADINALIA